MSEGDGDRPSEEDMAGRRADRLGRALMQARAKRQTSGVPSAGEPRPSRLPPPPPPPDLEPIQQRSPDISEQGQASAPVAPKTTKPPLRNLRSKDGRLPPPPPLDIEEYKELGLPIPAEVLAAAKADVQPAPSDTAEPQDPGLLVLQPSERVDPPEDMGIDESPTEPVITERPTEESQESEDAKHARMWHQHRALGKGLPADTELDPGPADELDVAPRLLFGSQDTFSHTPAPAFDGPALLTVSNLCTNIAQYQILRGVDLTVPEGAVTMLLGRNGAGKTTTMRTIMGLWQSRLGSVELGDRLLTGLSPTAIARLGVGYVPEDMGVFSDLTVEENMRLAARARFDRERLDWLMACFPPLRTFWRSPAGLLSGGQKQMLSLARAMVEPRQLYLIDEPTKGLAPAIVASLVEALRKLKDDGASMLIVEQNYAVAQALGDTCAVMDDGKVIWNGTMHDLAIDSTLRDRLLGLSMETSA
ncbi:MAG: ABC transporter ATP-binding protein [Pseudomonadota bacterium]